MINDKHEIVYKPPHPALALVDLGRKARYYETDMPISHSEIHVIMAIAEHPGIRVGGLVDILEVTKGAVPEVLKKLERKALVIKEIGNLSLSRHSLSLAEKGKKAHNNYIHYHTVLSNMVEGELKNVFEQELALLINLPSSLINRVKSFNENFDE